MQKALVSCAALLSLGMAGAPVSASEPALPIPCFVPMDDISVPIVGSDRIDGVLHVTLVLDASDSATAARLTEALPRLRATSVAAAIEFSRLYASERMPVDVARLTRDLTAALQHGNAGIARVLIVQVAAEPV